MGSKPNKSRGKAPITRHPLFPAMVALWFAALLGLGSLAIGPRALESLVLATGLDVIIPAAAPPLGFTARILLALLMFVVGAAIGLILARRLARSAAAPREGNMPKAAPVAVADREDDEDEDFARLEAARSGQSHGLRRRALAIEEDYTPPSVAERAPIPGGAPQILDLADLGPITAYMTAKEDPQGDTGSPTPPALPREGLKFTMPQSEAADAAPLAPMAPVVGAVSAVPEAIATETQGDAGMEAPRAFDPWNLDIDADAPVSMADALAQRPFAPPQAPVASTPATADDNPVASPRAFDPVEPMADGEDVGDEAAVPQSEPAKPIFAQPPLSAPLGGPRLGTVAPQAAAQLIAEPLDSLGVVQLAERLALAISRRKAAANGEVVASAALAQPVIESTAAYEPFEIDEPEVIESPVSLPPAPPIPVIPAALRPIDFTALDDDDDDMLDDIIPLRRFAAPAAAPQPAAFTAEPIAEMANDSATAETADYGSDEAPEEGSAEEFGSLLGLRPAARPEFVRIEEPEDQQAAIEPVVIFPGQGTRLTAPDSQAQGTRRFDAPLAADAATAPPTPSGPMPDAEETERALKAALATLQRMSGAA